MDHGTDDRSLRGGDAARAATPPGEVTRLLASWSGGDDEALTRVVTLVYEDLRRIARRHLQREREGHTLQGTALVHEVYLRLADKGPTPWASRAHFFSWASTMMRHILIDHARSRQAAKRGGGVEVLSLDALHDERGTLPGLAAQAQHDDGPDLIAVDQALRKLERLDPQQGRVVELRYFCGLSVAETAVALDVSPATVKREWVTARAWLLRELGRANVADAR